MNLTLRPPLMAIMNEFGIRSVAPTTASPVWVEAQNVAAGASVTEHRHRAGLREDLPPVPGISDDNDGRPYA